VAVSQDRAVELSQVFVRERRPDLAVDLWLDRCTEAGRQPSSEPTPEPELYTAVLEGCAAIGDFETASRVARSAAWRAPQDSYPGQQAMLALSRWLARRRAVSPALECYESVRRATGAWSGDRGAPDLTTHKAVLKACISSNDMMRAEILFHDLMSSQCSPDFGIFAAMIRGHRAAGRPEEAMSYFELMKRHGIRPDSSLFDVVLDCCCWKDVPSLVERVLADMEAAGVEPSSGTLATVLRLYGQSCKIDKALEAFEELPKRHGLQVDSRAYGAMITTCLQGGRLDLALETFDRMSAAGCRAKARTYEALLRACTRRGDLDRAVRLVDEALCLQEEPAAPETTTAEVPRQPRRPRAHIEPGHVEELLRLLGKRGEAARLGAPLAGRLRRAGCEVPEDLEAALGREAARQQSAQSPTVSPIHRRREVHTRWRDFQGAEK
jgi:pentatricopeptide repeat protein